MQRVGAGQRANRGRSLGFGIAGVVLSFLSACAGGGDGVGTGDSNLPGGEGDTALELTPTAPVGVSGEQGGPFTPSSVTYTLSNTAATAIAWSASLDQSWLTLTSTGGTLGGGLSTDLVVNIDQAAVLPPGTYTATLTVTDLSVPATIERDIVLTVTAPSGGSTSPLTVTPDSDLVASGDQGGPFTPMSEIYTLTNTGAAGLLWSATSDQSWVTVSVGTGSLAGGASTNVTVSIDAAQAAAFSFGTYTAKVTFSEATTPASFTRNVVLNVNTTTATTASSLSQFGIDWQFDKAYTVGQFVNGDWWVVGPVTITRITPGSTSGAREKNGSMINPSPMNGMSQGYDSSMYGQYRSAGDYDPALNVALDVSPSNPLVVPTGSSLVSTISVAAADARPQVQTAAVLTVLDAPAPAGSFRPPYSGSDKTIRFNESQLDTSFLAKLSPTGITEPVTMGEAERMFERPWIDHVPLWVGRYIHPATNMPDYGREITDNVSVASILLNMDYTDAEKHTLLVRFVQLGIDLYGILEDGGENNWIPSAGHLNGRKMPILFAGIVLGDPDMSSIGFDPTLQFSEDGQTFYVAETSPGVYNYGYGGYNASHVGMAEWGTAHSVKPSADIQDWDGDPYRQCCTANAWWGQLLAVYAMGAKSLWNHDEIFDYQDRYLIEMRNRGRTDWRLAWRDFYLDLWDAYRPSY